MDVADELGVGESAVGHYLNGRREPSLNQIRVIARMAGVSMSELVGEDDYFLVDKYERSLIDGFRNLSEQEREIAVRMVRSLHQEAPPDPDQD